MMKKDIQNHSFVRHLPREEKRVETGAIQFGDDWRGYFLRGDAALNIAMQIGILQEEIKSDNKSTSMILALQVLDILKKDIVEDIDEKNIFREK